VGQIRPASSVDLACSVSSVLH